MGHLKWEYPNHKMKPDKRRQVAFNDYLALGDDRSVRRLAQYYVENPEKAPTGNEAALHRWAQEEKWEAKAELYALEREARTALHEREMSLTAVPDPDSVDPAKQDAILRAVGVIGNPEAKIQRMERIRRAQATIDMIVNQAENMIDAMGGIEKIDPYFFFEKMFPQAVKLQTLINKEDRIERGEVGDRIQVDINIKAEVYREVLSTLPDSLREKVEQMLREQGKIPELPGPAIIEGDFKKETDG